MPHKGLLFAAAAALAALPALTPAAAEPGSPRSAPLSSPAGITQVQYYGPGYYGYHRWHYGYGPYYDGGLLSVPGDVIAGTAGAVGDVLGGPYTGPYARAGVAACERHFRSFDPATGTYTTYSGERVTCPYLGG
ncbi:MAG: BA14K family protein [Rhodomicrobium sp.]